MTDTPDKTRASGKTRVSSQTLASSDSQASDLTHYPWVQPAWEQIISSIETLHHGLLITGVPGIAKREFAMALSQLLLCSSEVENVAGGRQPCGQCQNCSLFMAGTHPDFHVLTTELETRDGRIELVTKYSDRYQDISAREKRSNPGKVIAVDQVRLLIERFYASAHIADRKIALIMPADRMNINSANALLKLLEEPPADSVLILVTAVPGYLPATVRSRCLRIEIPLAADKIAMTWLLDHMSADEAKLALRLSSGGPVTALKMFDDGFLQLQDKFLQGITDLVNLKISALDLAARFNKHDFLQLLDWLHRFNCELIQCSCGTGSPNWHSQTGLDCGRLPIEKLFVLYDRIGYYKKIARLQLNEQLAMEELMLALQYVIRA